MSQPVVSVVIPAYKQADFLDQAIQSVLDQTYPHFEIIVVNDASPDHTAAVVGQFGDGRLRYLAHEENRGLPATRNTGMRASVGELIALLDADDFFHQEKLQAHVDFLSSQPDVGVSYNNRFHLHHSATTIRKLYRAPQAVALADFVLGFPFAPSDMVVRREWAFKVNLFDEERRYGAEDVDFPARLALAGCRFGRVDRALNYRRHHSGRTWNNIRQRIEDARRALENIFSDPRCPPEVSKLRDAAVMNHYKISSGLAFLQQETDLGQELLREAIRLAPSIIEGDPCPYVELLTDLSSADENRDHVALLHTVFSQFPPELRHVLSQRDWAIARGCFIKGFRAMIWQRFDNGKTHLRLAAELGARINASYLSKLVDQMVNYEAEFGPEPAQQVVAHLIPAIEKFGGRAGTRDFKGRLSFHRAFHSYRHKDYQKVPGEVVRTVLLDPRYLTNRGGLAILLRSLVRICLRVVSTAAAEPLDKTSDLSA
jgi:glycosyltransferase involved in cell wall biosynthesis